MNKNNTVKIAKRIDLNDENLVSRFCQKHELEQMNSHINIYIELISNSDCVYNLNDNQLRKAKLLLETEEQFNYDSANDEILSIHERNTRMIENILVA